MKQLLMGVVLLVLLGIAGFFYRNALETPGAVTACPMDAMVCPDGSSVGRVGPACAFAPCPATAEGLSYDVPAGYVADKNAYGADSSTLAAFVKPSASGSPSHTIIVKRYPVAEGETAEAVILAHTTFQPADMQADSMDKFTTATIGGNTFRSVVIERFEAIVHSAYYLVRDGQVYKFEVTEHDVVDWMEPNLVVETLPEHAALVRMLESLRF